MSDYCLNCSGLIMEPNKAYGYAGPVCLCPKNPAHQYQRPSKLNTNNQCPLCKASDILRNKICTINTMQKEINSKNTEISQLKELLDDLIEGLDGHFGEGFWNSPSGIKTRAHFGHLNDDEESAKVNPDHKLMPNR